MELEQLLRAALTPCNPEPALSAAVMARVTATQRAPRRGRSLLYGTLLLAVAAAAMLASYLMGSASVGPVAVIPEQESAPGVAAVAAELPILVSPAVESVQDKTALKEVAPAVEPFTVSVQLQNQAKDAANIAVESFYTELLDKLRSVPGLTLVGQAKEATAPASADYRLMVQGTGPVGGDKFVVVISVNPMELPGIGSIGKSGFGTAGSIADPLDLVTKLMEDIRSKVLPPDPAYTQRLQARLLDSALDSRQRMKALTDLAANRRVPAGAGGASLDSVTLKGVVSLATNTTDPEQRAQIWRTLRGIRNADLVPALVTSLRDDSSMEVRIEALATLNTDYRDDARARTTLEAVAREDARPLMRALAQRALTGDAAWKRYIVLSLQDTARPASERIEAFAYQMYGMIPGSFDNFGTGDRKLLDDEMIQALSQVAPQVANLPTLAMLNLTLPGNLLATGNPAGVDVVLRMAQQTTEPNAKANIVRQLTQNSSNSHVRTVLEKVSADDSDPQLRQIATEVLQAAGPQDVAMAAGLGMVLGILKQNPDPALQSSLTRQVIERSRDPAMRAAMEKISREDPDPQLRQIAADLLKSATSVGK